MFTFRDAGVPSPAQSAARRISRAILLAGLTLPFVPFVQNGLASDAPPALAKPAPAGQGLGQEMTDAIAGMRYALSQRDLMLYRRVFSAIDDSDWATVDATVPHIQDRRLIGHVRAARFLSSGADTPFADKGLPRDSHFVAPELVAQVRFSEWTEGGRIRHPAYLGLRDDKDAIDVRRE